MTNPRWKHRPPGSNWGDFGPDDQRGRLNLITPEKVRQGLAEAREGITFCLSLPLDYPGGNVMNPRRSSAACCGRPCATAGRISIARWSAPTAIAPTSSTTISPCCICNIRRNGIVSPMSAGCSTPTATGGPERVYYNGFRAGAEIVGPEDAADAGAAGAMGAKSTSGAHALGIEQMAAHGVQGRGVLIDLHAHFGDERKLVGYDDLMAVMAADQVVVEPGDMRLPPYRLCAAHPRDEAKSGSRKCCTEAARRWMAAIRNC